MCNVVFATQVIYVFSVIGFLYGFFGYVANERLTIEAKLINQQINRFNKNLRYFRKDLAIIENFLEENKECDDIWILVTSWVDDTQRYFPSYYFYDDLDPFNAKDVWVSAKDFQNIIKSKIHNFERCVQSLTAKLSSAKIKVIIMYILAAIVVITNVAAGIATLTDLIYSMIIS